VKLHLLPLHISPHTWPNINTHKLSCRKCKGGLRVIHRTLGCCNLTNSKNVFYYHPQARLKFAQHCTILCPCHNAHKRTTYAHKHTTHEHTHMYCEGRVFARMVGISILQHNIQVHTEHIHLCAHNYAHTYAYSHTPTHIHRDTHTIATLQIYGLTTNLMDCLRALGVLI